MDVAKTNTIKLNKHLLTIATPVGIDLTYLNISRVSEVRKSPTNERLAPMKLI